jgi:hypothetical protein
MSANFLCDLILTIQTSRLVRKSLASERRTIMLKLPSSYFGVGPRPLSRLPVVWSGS